MISKQDTDCDIDGLVQVCSISSALAMEMRQSCRSHRYKYIFCVIITFWILFWCLEGKNSKCCQAAYHHPSLGLPTWTCGTLHPVLYTVEYKRPHSWDCLATVSSLIRLVVMQCAQWITFYGSFFLLYMLSEDINVVCLSVLCFIFGAFLFRSSRAHIVSSVITVTIMKTWTSVRGNETYKRDLNILLNFKEVIVFSHDDTK